MELYALWRVIKRRWWLALIPVVVAAFFAAWRYEAPPTVYTVGMRFTAAQAPDPAALPAAANPYEDAHYVPWLASEYLVNALTHWVQTGSFVQAVSAHLVAGGVDIEAGALMGAFRSDNRRSVMGVYINWHDPHQLQQIAEAARDALQSESGAIFPQTAAGPVMVVPLDSIGVGTVPPSLMSQVKALLPVLIGLAAGLVLAFVVEYLDPTVYARDDLEVMGIAVLAEVPGE